VCRIRHLPVLYLADLDWGEELLDKLKWYSFMKITVWEQTTLNIELLEDQIPQLPSVLTTKEDMSIRHTHKYTIQMNMGTN